MLWLQTHFCFYQAWPPQSISSSGPLAALPQCWCNSTHQAPLQPPHGCSNATACVQGVARSGETGDFVARPVASRYTDTEQLAETIRQDPESVFIVDAREVGEYDGANPYNNGVALCSLPDPATA